MTDHPVFARVQAWSAARAEERGAARTRSRLAEGLRGVVVEIGPGRGLQFAHYPASVTRLIALEPEAGLRAMTRRAPSTVPVTLLDASADELPIADGSVDAVVCAGVLCSVTDPAAVLAGIARVLRPDGTVRVYDHVRSEHPIAGTAQQLLDRSGLWARAMAGCRTSRDIGALLAVTPGLAVEAAQRFTFRPTPLDLPVAPKLLAVARRTD